MGAVAGEELAEDGRERRRWCSRTWARTWRMGRQVTDDLAKKSGDCAGANLIVTIVKRIYIQKLLIWPCSARVMSLHTRSSSLTLSSSLLCKRVNSEVVHLEKQGL